MMIIRLWNIMNDRTPPINRRATRETWPRRTYSTIISRLIVYKHPPEELFLGTTITCQQHWLESPTFVILELILMIINMSTILKPVQLHRNFGFILIGRIGEFIPAKCAFGELYRWVNFLSPRPSDVTQDTRTGSYQLNGPMRHISHLLNNKWTINVHVISN